MSVHLLKVSLTSLNEMFFFKKKPYSFPKAGMELRLQRHQKLDWLLENLPLPRMTSRLMFSFSLERKCI